ncbi:EAL domain-containing protein [Nitratidesulfovibrio sp.]|uniref:EAL domain-containing response regulator n=1 Tax=Nitratidesulfovibrio sp. TaxID=2802297 RepID=UPI003340E5CB
MLQRPPRILTIDDDVNVRSNLVAYLEDSGFDVIEAENGRRGLEAFAEHAPDLVLVDLRMPVMGGMEVLERLREDAPEVPVIVVSGVGVLEEAVEALRHGAWDYVTKPVTDMRVLEHAVNKALERARLLEERKRYREHLELEVQERTRELRETNERLVEYQALLQEKNQFLEALVESMPNPVFYKTLEGTYIGCNRAFSRLIGRKPEDIVGRSVTEILPQELACLVDETTGSLPSPEDEDGAGYSCMIDLRDAAGEDRVLVLYKSYFRDRTGQRAGVVGTFLDVSELKRKEAQIVHQATHDELTGLPNRMGLRQRMEDHARKGGPDTRLAVLYLDMDNFKTVNDSLGHAVGDELLRAVAGRLVGMAPRRDMVARLGGDEFVMLLPLAPTSMGEGDGEVAEAESTRIQDAFTRPFNAADHELYVMPSIGISVSPDDGRDPATLLKNAEIAMYRAKEQGGARFRRFTQAMNDDVTRRLAIEKSIRKGLENDEFVVFYQPRVDITTGQVTGMEALVRWARSDGTIVPPLEFIPVAEDTGLVVALGERVLRDACMQTRRWTDELGPLRIAVNISARQFQPDLLDRVQAALVESGLPPSQLELEITETTMMRDLPTSVSILERLAAQGISIAIDDFGTGHSSLYYLKNFPIDTIKIDRSFVRDVPGDEGDATIVSTIVTMGRNLSLNVVAEGVETDDQLDFLRAHGCREVQGYYYSKPLPAAGFADWMRAVLASGGRT